MANVLAEGVVQFVAEGVGRVEAAVARIFSGLNKLATAGSAAVGKFLQAIKKAGQGVRDFTSKAGTELDKTAKSFAIFAALTSAAIGAFTAKALSGTVEGERMALAFQRLTMVLGDQLGPYIRKLTGDINTLTTAIAKVDPDTRNWITGLVLATGAITAAVLAIVKITAAFSPFLIVVKLSITLLGALVPVLLSVGGALLAALGPIGVVIAGVALLIGAFVGLGAVMGAVQGDAITVGGALAGIYEIFADIASVISEVSMAIWDELVGGVKFFGEAFTQVYTGIILPVVDGIGQAFAALYDVFQPVVDAIGNAFAGLIEYFRPVITQILTAWSDFIGSITFTWKGMIRLLGDILLGGVVLIAQGINGISTIFAVAIRGIINTFASLGETVGLISKDMAKQMREFSNAIPNDLIDVDKLTNRMGEASNRIGAMLDKNADKAKEMADNINENFKAIEAPKIPEVKIPKIPGVNVPGVNLPGQQKGPGTTRKFDVGFESFTGSFDRLQKAFATNVGDSVDKAQLNELQIGNQLQREANQAINRIQFVV